MTFSKEAVMEMHDLTNEARRLANGTQAERKMADVLMTQVANIRATGVSNIELRRAMTEGVIERIHGASGETFEQRAKHEAAFRRLIMARNDRQQKAAEQEFRDMEAGSQTISYTNGSGGGYLVPQVFWNDVVTALAQTDPLLDPKRVNLIQETGYAMNPKTISGYDLTQISATRVSESTTVSTPMPYVSGQQLNGYIYKQEIYGSIEIEDDDFEGVSRTLSRAFGVGFARGIGVDLVNGTGSGNSQPAGILPNSSNSGVTTQTAGKITYTDIVNIYFSVNRIYRMAPKCAWVMNDQTFKLVRSATDNNGRPLISVLNDIETLMGQPVLVSPSMPWGSGAEGILFGDLSHFNVRLSAMTLTRAFQVSGGSDYLRALYVGRMRADSNVLDPAIQGSPVDTSGAPIQYATLK